MLNNHLTFMGFLVAVIPDIRIDPSLYEVVEVFAPANK